MIFGEGPIIKNIAGDLNKLFLQGTRAGQPINNVEGDAAADQGTVQLMADRDPVIRDISTGLGWAGREVTVSGTGALQLVNSLGRPLKSWSVELAPYQEGSGDPSPENVRPIHGTNKLTVWTAGKNLLKLDDISYTLNGLTLTCVNGVVTVNGTATADTIINIKPQYAYTTLDNIFPVTPNTNYVLSGCTNGSPSTYWLQLLINGSGVEPMSTNGDSSPFAFTAQQIATQQRRVAVRVANGTVMDNVKFYPMIRFASDSDATYEPYKDVTSSVITLPQTVYNGTVGSVGGVCRTSKYRASVVSGTWTRTTNGFAVYISVLDGIRTGIQQCDKFAFNSNGYSNMPLYSWFGASGASTTFTFILPATITTVSEANQWIADNGGYIEFTYQLINPETFSIVTPTIYTPEGYGSVWITAENGIVTNFSVTYLQDE